MKKQFLLCALIAAVGSFVISTAVDTVIPPQHDEVAQVDRYAPSVQPSAFYAHVQTVSDEPAFQLPSSGYNLFDANGIAKLVLAILLGVAGWFWRSNKMTEERRKIFLTGLDVSYGVINNIAKMTPNTIDDKAAWGLDELRKFLAANGQDATLTANEEQTARQVFDAKHGMEPKIGALVSDLVPAQNAKPSPQ